MGGEIENYGVWVGTPISYRQETEAEDPKSPHIYLKYTDDNDQEKKAAINVKSTDADTRLVYWFNRSFEHPITNDLSELDLGFRRIKTTDDPLALDFWRILPSLFDQSEGVIMETGDNLEAEIDPILDRAIDEQATCYLFGSAYRRMDGIHNIHCNQGSKPKYDNATFSDGAVMFRFPDGRFEAIFLAFASQRFPTRDDNGEATRDSTPLSSLVSNVRENGVVGRNQAFHRL